MSIEALYFLNPYRIQDIPKIQKTHGILKSRCVFTRI